MGIPKFMFKMLASCAGQAIKSKISNEDWQEKVIAEFGGTSVETVIDQISKKINSEKKAKERLESILKKSFSEINIKYDDKFAGAYELLKSTSAAVDSAEDLRELLIEWNNNRESIRSLDYSEIEAFATEFYIDISNKIMNDDGLHELTTINKIIFHLKELNDDFKNESDITQEKLDKIIELIITILGENNNSDKIITNTSPSGTSTVFIGRENDIEDIKEKAKTKKVVLMNGIGGIGKTEICRYLFKYYNDNAADDVEYIGWVNYNTSLDSSFFGNFKGIEEQDSTKYKQAVKNRIDKFGNKLLLFVDNANDISDSEAVELSKFACRIIMTSRKNKVTSFHPFEVKKLSPEKCLEIYQDYSNDHSAESVENIEKILILADYHTQTVELLAKTQDNSGLSAKELLEQLTSNGFSLAGISETVDGRHGDDVTNEIFIEHLAIIFDISKIAPIEEQINVLRLFSLIAPNEPLDKKTIKTWFSLENLNPVNDLIKSGWLKADENNKISIHPVISEVVRYKYPAEFEFAKELVYNLAYELNDSREKGLGIAIWNKLIIHSATVAKCINDTKNEYYSTLLNNIGCIYKNKGNYLKAMEYFEKSLIIFEEVIGTENPSTATSYNNIGFLYKSIGDYLKAIEYYEKALKIREKVFGTLHRHTAQSNDNIGGVYYSMGNYNKALEFYKKALNISEKVLGTEHPDTAISYNNIGLLYNSMSDYSKALEYHKMALNTYEKVLGIEHPDTATSYNNIGLLYDSMGDYPKALEYHEKALKIREKVLGTLHPQTAQSYDNMGGVYKNISNYPKTLEYHKIALNIYEKVLGTEHSSTATCYNNIGCVYCSMNDYPKALEFYVKALNIREIVLGTEHPSTATSYNDIGGVYYNMGNYNKSLEYITKTKEIFEKVLGENHPNTKKIYRNLAGIYKKIGDKENADEYYWKSL